MRGQALIAAATMAAALLGAAQPAAAQYGSYHEQHVSNHYQCQQSRNNRTAGGAVIGGILGAVQGSYDPYTGQYRRYEDNDPYYRDDSGLEGGPYRESGYGYGDDDYGRDCRMGQIITRDPYGREYHENVMMCRGGDGVWRPRD